jgi:hypothetical protein
MIVLEKENVKMAFVIVRKDGEVKIAVRSYVKMHAMRTVFVKMI